MAPEDLPQESQSYGSHAYSTSHSGFIKSEAANALCAHPHAYNHAACHAMRGALATMTYIPLVLRDFLESFERIWLCERACGTSIIMTFFSAALTRGDSPPLCSPGPTSSSIEDKRQRWTPGGC